jgi:hypothetical protein
MWGNRSVAAASFDAEEGNDDARMVELDFFASSALFWKKTRSLGDATRSC